MYTLNGWWFLSSGGSYPLVFTVVPSKTKKYPTCANYPIPQGVINASWVFFRDNRIGQMLQCTNLP